MTLKPGGKMVAACPCLDHVCNISMHVFMSTISMFLMPVIVSISMSIVIFC